MVDVFALMRINRTIESVDARIQGCLRAHVRPDPLDEEIMRRLIKAARMVAQSLAP